MDGQTDGRTNRRRDRTDKWTDKVYLLLVPGLPDGSGGSHGDGVPREEGGEGKPVVIVVLLQVLQLADYYAG